MAIKITTYLLSISLLAIIYSCGQTSSANTKEKAQTLVQKDTCDDPDADINCSFVNMPDNVSNIMTMAGNNEPGERMIISGTVFKEDGRTPYPNAILYAYQTDSKGLYSKRGDERGAQKWHGKLYGWCKTNSKGYYEIHSIRPAPYPTNTMPAHIHAAIKLENRQPFYISDFVFKDDTLVNEKYLSTIISTTGGDGIVDIKKSGSNIWTGKRGIVLK